MSVFWAVFRAVFMTGFASVFDATATIFAPEELAASLGADATGAGFCPAAAFFTDTGCLALSSSL